MVADEDGGRQQQHVRLGGGLQWGRMREGIERQRKQRSGDAGCGGGRQRWRTTTARRTMIAAEGNCRQDWAADYNGEGQEWAAREGGDSGVAMMAAAAEDSGGGRQWRRLMTTGMADNNSSRQKRQRMMTACEIERRTTRGKEESGRKTTTALGQPQLASRAESMIEK